MIIMVMAFHYGDQLLRYKNINKQQTNTRYCAHTDGMTKFLSGNLT